MCADCTKRREDIQKALDARDSLRCTCSGKKKDRCHLPTNEKCDLYASRKMGEKQWPGKTKGLLKVIYVSWTSWRNADECNALKQQRTKKCVQCSPGNELPKDLCLSSFPPSSKPRLFYDININCHSSIFYCLKNMIYNLSLSIK